MKVESHISPIPYLEVTDIFKPKKYQEVLNELKWLESGSVFGGPERTGTARRQDGTVKKNNRGVFLNQFYADLSLSPLNVAIKQSYPYIFNFKNSHQNWYLNLYSQTQMQGGALISYYEESNYYESHADHSTYTFLFWIWDESDGKKFTGGDLKFTDFDIEIECKNNCGVVFPGPINHEVSKIEMPEEYKGKGLGRFAISEFIAPAIPMQNQ
jgi:hypothetical protein